jgi:hypothetical protein
VAFDDVLACYLTKKQRRKRKRNDDTNERGRAKEEVVLRNDRATEATNKSRKR